LSNLSLNDLSGGEKPKVATEKSGRQTESPADDSLRAEHAQTQTQGRRSGAEVAPWKLGLLEKR